MNEEHTSGQTGRPVIGEPEEFGPQPWFGAIGIQWNALTPAERRTLLQRDDWMRLPEYRPLLHIMMTTPFARLTRHQKAWARELLDPTAPKAQ